MRIKLFLLGLLLFSSLNSSCYLASGPADGIYLIPKGYTGDVIIFFDQPDGVVPEVEDGRNVYKIPEGGLLKVKAKGEAGVVNLSYFYAGPDNERQEVKYLRVTGDRNPAGEPQDKFGGLGLGDYEDDTFVMNAGGLGSFNTKRGVVRYTSFIVGTPKNADQLYDRMQKRLSTFQRKFIEQSNNGMHPTPLQRASHARWIGARVMPGVGRLDKEADA